MSGKRQEQRISPALSDRPAPGPKLAGMTETDRLSLNWCLDLAARRVGEAVRRGFEGGFVSHIPRGLWAALCREVAFLEAVVRRLLIALVGVLPEPAKAHARRAISPVSSRGTAPSPPSGTALLEPLPDAVAMMARLMGEAQTGRKSGGNPLPAVMPAARLWNRLASLKALLADPEAAARRMARRLALRRELRKSPLHLGHRPAAARSRHWSQERDVFFEVARLALLVLNRPPG